MSNRKKLSTRINRLLDVPVSDQDDARRRKLLNIILIGMMVLAVFTILITFIGTLLKFAGFNAQDTPPVYASGIFLLLGSIAFFSLNRNKRVPGWIASSLFLIFIMVILAFSDTASELAGGRSLFIFVLPVVLAGILLKPIFSFIFCVLVAVEISILGYASNTNVNQLAIISFFLVALISWLSGRGLEQALKELRVTNANLDGLVHERTEALAEALTRERAEAGRSKAILESIADGVIVFDINGNAILFNPAILHLLQLPSQNVDHATVDDLINSKYLDAKDKGVLAGMLTSPGQQSTSYRIKWGKKTLFANSAQVFDIDGIRIGTVGVFRDFTREAEVEQLKSTFLAMISHELRTPLNAILGYAEILKESIYGPINEKQVRTSERIMTNTRRLLDMVSDILDQTQMDAGKMTIHYRPFRPAELVENVHGVMDKIATDKNLTLTSELDPALPNLINGDAARLQQILINLINNAIKFTAQGSINFRIYRQDDKHWVLEVRDTGIGIPEDELPLIYDAFHQVDSTDRREYGGFGLGLSIVKQLASLMSGEANAISKLGAGSVFSVTLPLVVPEENKND
jgi:PAS domain S-box-containing protein